MFAYVGSRTTRDGDARGAGLSAYRVDERTGAWSLAQVVGDLVNPSFLTLDAAGRHLYAVHGGLSEVSAFRIDAVSGELSYINRASTEGRNPVAVAVDPSGRFLVVANYATGTLAALRLAEDGSVGSVTSLEALPGEPGPHPTEQASSHPHHVRFDRAGGRIYVPDKGLDRVFIFRLHAQSGRLEANEDAWVQARSGAGPRHIDFHPSRPFAYVVNEMDSTVTAYRHEPGGSLVTLQVVSTLPPSHTSDNTGAEIAVAPSGRFVYASNRGHDSIAIFSVDPGSGTLTPAGWESTRGNVPRFFAFDPTGRFLLAANEGSASIERFAVDASSGSLAHVDQVRTGSPVCIVFAG